jgi:hypothetical protein
VKTVGNPVSPCRAGDGHLQLFALNEECLVGAVQQTAPIVSLPFVHTARRSYQWGGGREPRSCAPVSGSTSPDGVMNWAYASMLEEGKVVTR